MKVYRFLTHEDTSEFCHKVTKALGEGWVLYGDPTYGFDGANGIMRCGQAVTKDVDVDYDPAVKLGAL